MDNENIYYVYEWIRLDKNEPFYVGKGKGDRCYRLKRGNNHHFNNIVKSIPTAVHILHDNLSEEEAHQYECWYINEYKYNICYEIVNITDGGEGTSGYKQPEEVVKRNRTKTHGFDIEDFKDEIVDMYANQLLSSDKIAEYFNVSDVCIRRVLRKFKTVFRKSGSIKGNDRGLKIHNSRCVLVKDLNDNIVNCFESIALCGEWLVDIGLVKKSGGGNKAIHININTNKSYKGLLFFNINQTELENISLEKNKFVPYVVNNINIISPTYSTIIEVYDKKSNLIKTYPSLIECANWLIEIEMSKSFSAARDAIHRCKNNNKFYKNAYTFKQYSKDEYNRLIS